MKLTIQFVRSGLSGILIDKDMVPVQSDNGEYALPGGRVKIGKTAEETLVRDFLRKPA